MARILKLLVPIVLLLGVAFGATAWLRRGDAGEKGIKLVEVTTGTITEKAVAVGRIEPRLKFHVKSKMSGIVRRCATEVGDLVKPGDTLFEIEPDPTPSELIEAERRLESARSALTRAEADFARAEGLFEAGIMSGAEHETRRDACEQAKITHKQASDNLELIRKGRVAGGGAAMESIVRAPSGGTLLERKVNPGDPVVPLTSYQEGTELATIADMSDMIFRGTVDEIDVGKLAAGLSARIKVGALPSEQVTGRLNRIAPQATEKEGARLFEVEIELDPSQVAHLRAGYSANADLVIREKSDILTIPERLVQFEEEGKRAYVELPGSGSDSKPRRVEIQTGLSDGLNIEVVSGLSKGDKVIERPPKEIS
jgi:HlyD family secretion protein